MGAVWSLMGLAEIMTITTSIRAADFVKTHGDRIRTVKLDVTSGSTIETFEGPL
jgi:hypothetical protein